MVNLESKVSKDELFLQDTFPRCSTWHHKQVSFLVYDLFVWITEILFEYCSTDIVPEVGFVTPISDGVVFITFAIDVVFSVSYSAKALMLQ